MDAPDDHKLTRLRLAAIELPVALDRANQELPADFPDAALRQIAANLQTLEEATSDADHQTLVHARSTLRTARRMLQGDPGDLETGLERALKDVVVEIDELLEAVPSAELIVLRPEDGPGPMVARRDLEGKVAALEQRLDAMTVAGNESITQINQYGLNIGEVKVDLDALIKVAADFKAEIANKLIDLGWLTHFSERVKALNDALGKGAAAIRQAAGELAHFVQGLQRVRQLGNRVFQGGRALVHAVNRLIKKLAPPTSPFRDVDAPWCPEMVVIPAGSFLMGSPKDEAGRRKDEGPQHEVRIAEAFGLGRYPVTFAEYDHFCAATGRDPPSDEDWGRGRRPVLNVWWDYAQAYVAWLSETTGQTYRLPSEAEWEYACRAGMTTRFVWGDADPTPGQANFGRKVGKTSEVGGYPPNPWGLSDMHGNVWEWVEDRWHGNYKNAPADGSAWIVGNIGRRVLRGGSWNNNSENLRSANRGGYDPVDRNNGVGFRVARTLR